MTRPEPDAQADLAFERWEAGDFETAAQLYAQLVTATDADNYNSPTYLASYAAVLAELGRHDDAREAYERAVAAELALGSPEASAPVAVARYFLAEHALRVSEPRRALDAVMPSLGTATKLRAVLYLVKAEAHVVLGEPEAARTAALVAVAGASSPEQREKFLVRLSRLGLSDVSDAG